MKAQSHTSSLRSVSIDVDPNSVEHTSPERFDDVEKMNNYMIDQFNSRVRKNDEVVILGDFCYAGAKEAKEILDQLNGRLYLIVGNHDKFINYRKEKINRFVRMKEYDELHDNGRKVILSHYPIMCYNGQYRLNKEGIPNTYMLYGHVHDTHDEELVTQYERMVRQKVIDGFDGNKRNIPCNMINCYCGYSNYVPLTLDEWINLTNKRRGYI